MIYVVGGQGASGLLADVWASDTAGRSWARMCPRAPFGPRTGVACATVPGNPLVLVVAGAYRMMCIEIYGSLGIFSVENQQNFCFLIRRMITTRSQNAVYDMITLSHTDVFGLVGPKN